MALLLCACGAQESQETSLTLQCEGLEEGALVMLTDAADYDFVALDTACVAQGKAVFVLPGEEPRAYRMFTSEARCLQVIAVGPQEQVVATGKATIEKDGKFLTLTDFKVSGSATHDSLMAATPDREAMNKAYEDYHAKHKAVLDKAQSMQRGSDEWKALCETDEWKAFEADEHAFFQMVETSITDAITGNSDNWMGPFFMLTQYSYLTTEANLPQYEAMSEEVKDSYYGKLVAEKVVPMTTDEPMPDFTFTDHATGQTMSLLDICKQHKYVLIDFWASWCKPCRNEIPNFKKQYELYHDKGLQIVSISADAKEADWLKALEEEQLPWPNDIDGDKGICKLFKVQFYPTVYLLDSEGRVLASNDDARGEALQKKLAELFQ